MPPSSVAQHAADAFNAAHQSGQPDMGLVFAMVALALVMVLIMARSMNNQ